MRVRLLFTAVPMLTIAAALLGGAASAQEPAAAPTESGRAVVSEPIADLGDVTYGTIRNHDFVVRNTGTGVLRIHSAKSNCLCTVVDFTKEIAPGAEGKVSVSFTAELQGGPTAVGVEAVTSDPETPTLKLTVKANVRYFIQAKPGLARYIVVQHFEEDSTVAQTLWTIDGKPMRITKVETPYDFIETEFREALPEEREEGVANEQQWRVETRISPTSPIGPLTGFITIHIDHPDQKIVKLPLHGFVRPMFAVTPAIAEWPPFAIEEGTSAMASLHVKNFAEELVKITGAEVDVPGITTQVVESEPGRVYYVKLLFPPQTQKGEIKGTVRITTDSPKQPVIEIPLKQEIL